MTESEFTEAWCAVCVHCNVQEYVEEVFKGGVWKKHKNYLYPCCQWYVVIAHTLYLRDHTCEMFHPDPLRFRKRACSAREPRENIILRLWAKTRDMKHSYGRLAFWDILPVGGAIRQKALTLYFGRQA
jgi:hypothetical protein